MQFVNLNHCNMFQKFCQHYYDSWILILKNFGKKNFDSISQYKKKLAEVSCIFS